MYVRNFLQCVQSPSGYEPALWSDREVHEVHMRVVKYVIIVGKGKCAGILTIHTCASAMDPGFTFSTELNDLKLQKPWISSLRDIASSLAWVSDTRLRKVLAARETRTSFLSFPDFGLNISFNIS